MPGTGRAYLFEYPGNSILTYEELNFAKVLIPLMGGSLSVYLKGGEYIRPPFVQRAFNPRFNISVVFSPTFLSKTSP